jgi:hypothetical protein
MHKQNVKASSIVSNADNIDFVITWVNVNDPQWQTSIEKHKIENSEGKATDASEQRYRDWDNLKYLFRSIDVHAPWVNKIHFVAHGDIPKWLNVRNPRINIVKDEDFMPKKYLPSFNSVAIEINFHRIKNLSEQFVYFNDDMFILKDLKKEHFFVNGLPCDHAMQVPNTSSNPEDIYPHMIYNVTTMINKHFNKHKTIASNPLKWFNPKYGIRSNLESLLSLPFKDFIGFYWSHQPSPFLKSTIKEIWDKEPDYMDRNSKYSFRHIQNTTPYLFSAWQYVTGKFHPTRIHNKHDYYFDLSKDLDSAVKAIRQQSTPLICINDSANVSDFEKAKKEIIDAFESILPNKSSFEL